MKLARIIEKVTMRPWFITPGGYAAVREILDAKLAGIKLDSGDDMENAQLGYAVDQNGIAAINVAGTLGQHLSMIEKICGGVDYQDIESTVNEAIEDGAKGILLHIDSPGGMASGCAECAAFLSSVNVPKVVFTDSQLCSAAYYLASGCDNIIASQSADVGSIGTIIPWVDKSQAWAVAGLKFDPITGDGESLKSTGHGPSITEEQRQYLQDSVNDSSAEFQAHVSANRDLDYTALRAGAYTGKRALALNLIDKLGTYADAYNELLRRVALTTNNK